MLFDPIKNITEIYIILEQISSFIRMHGRPRQVAGVKQGGQTNGGHHLQPK